MKKTVEYYMNLPYRLELIPDTDEGGYAARYPDLPGCMTCSDTMEGALANILEAKRAWLEAALQDGTEIAEPATDEDLSQYSGQFKLRMPKSLHRSLAIHARKGGISMNQYCIYLLSKNDAVV